MTGTVEPEGAPVASAAASDLYRRYGDQIYWFCRRHLPSREEAEDAVQVTFLKAFRGLQRGNTPRFEQAWVYKIAQRVCIARSAVLRVQLDYRAELEGHGDFDSLEVQLPSNAVSEAARVELMRIEDLVKTLPANQRHVLFLREWHGLSYREIEQVLGLSKGSVEMLLFRARRAIAAELDADAA